MKALTYIEHGKFALLDKPKPEILDSRDAIARVTFFYCALQINIGCCADGNEVYATEGRDHTDELDLLQNTRQ